MIMALYSEWDLVNLTRDLWLSLGPIEDVGGANVVACFCKIHMKYVPSVEDIGGANVVARLGIIHIHAFPWRWGRRQCCCQFLHNARERRAFSWRCCHFLHNTHEIRAFCWRWARQRQESGYSSHRTSVSNSEFSPSTNSYLFKSFSLQKKSSCTLALLMVNSATNT